MNGWHRLGAVRPTAGRLQRFLARPWRLALLVLLAIGIPTATVSVRQTRETFAELRSQALAQGTRVSDSVAAVFDDRLGELRDALTTVAADPDVRDAAAARDGVRLASLLHRARAVMGPQVASLKAFDHSGTYLSGSPFQPELIGTAASGSDHFVRAILAAGPSVSGVETPGTDSVPTVAVATPIRDRAGELVGVATAHVDLERVAGWVTAFLPSVDDVYIIDGRGRLVARASDPRDRALHDLSADPAVRALLGGGIASDAADPLTGRPVLVAGRPLAVTGWHVLTVSSAERLERQFQPLATSFVATTVVLVALLLGAAVLLAHTSARALDALRQEALTDPLTGLYNRRFMNEQLALFDSLAQRHGRPYSVIAFDLDGLKRVNDTFGHDAGDEVIGDFGLLLRDSLRDSDIAVRLGGDEFVAILPETSMPDATAAFERVRAAVKQRADDPRRAVTVSAGAVTWHAGRAPDELVQVADEMLYRAKRAGRDRVVAEPQAS